MTLWLKGRLATVAAVVPLEDSVEPLESVAREEIMAEDEKEEVRVDMTLALEGGGDTPRPLDVPWLVLIAVGALFVVSFSLPSFETAAVSNSLSVLSLEEGVDKPELSTEGKALPIPRCATVGEERATLVLDLPEFDEEVEATLLEEDTGGKDAALVVAWAAVEAAVVEAAAAAAFAFSFLDKGGVAVVEAAVSGGRDVAVVAVAAVAAASASEDTAAFELFLPDGGGGLGVERLAFAKPLPLEPDTLLVLAWRVSFGGTAEVPGARGVAALSVGFGVAFPACASPCSAMDAIEPTE